MSRSFTAQQESCGLCLQGSAHGALLDPSVAPVFIVMPFYLVVTAALSATAEPDLLKMLQFGQMDQ